MSTFFPSVRVQKRTIKNVYNNDDNIVDGRLQRKRRLILNEEDDDDNDLVVPTGVNGEEYNISSLIKIQNNIYSLLFFH